MYVCVVAVCVLCVCRGLGDDVFGCYVLCGACCVLLLCLVCVGVCD